jgi:hypothetical protein
VTEYLERASRGNESSRPGRVPGYDRPVPLDAFQRGERDARQGRRYDNPYVLVASGGMFRGYLVGYQSVYRFGHAPVAEPANEGT